MTNIHISEKAHPLLLHYLTLSGCTVNLVSARGITYQAVDTHADLFFCQLGVTGHTSVFRGDVRELGYRYPENIRFNAVCLDNYFVHHVSHTSPALLHAAQARGVTLINVKQGYTKCNCVVVDGHSVITADEGILRTLKGYPDIDVLPIRQGFVRLEGFPYGFLGGASGRVGNEVIFNGDLSAHPDFAEIRGFIESRGLAIKYFPAYPLTDIGSILED